MVGPHARAALLLGHAGGHEARLLVAGVRRGHGRDAGTGAVVVRHHQAVGRHEGRRAAGDPHRREAHVVEPTLVRPKAVCLLPVVERWRVEGPHRTEFLDESARRGLRSHGCRSGGEHQEGEKGKGEERRSAARRLRLHGFDRGWMVPCTASSTTARTRNSRVVRRDWESTGRRRKLAPRIGRRGKICHDPG